MPSLRCLAGLLGRPERHAWLWACTFDAALRAEATIQVRDRFEPAQARSIMFARSQCLRGVTLPVAAHSRPNHPAFTSFPRTRQSTGFTGHDPEGRRPTSPSCWRSCTRRFRVDLGASAIRPQWNLKSVTEMCHDIPMRVLSVASWFHWSGMVMVSYCDHAGCKNAAGGNLLPRT